MRRLSGFGIGIPSQLVEREGTWIVEREFDLTFDGVAYVEQRAGRHRVPVHPIGEYTVEYGSQDMTSNAQRVLTAYRRIGI